jgi:hypothetical protein
MPSKGSLAQEVHSPWTLVAEWHLDDPGSRPFVVVPEGVTESKLRSLLPSGYKLDWVVKYRATDGAWVIPLAQAPGRTR